MTEVVDTPDSAAAPDQEAAAQTTPGGEPFEPAHRDGLADEAGIRIGEQFVLNLDVFEGPLDVLLTLARDQKVDLRKISILALAEQYLVFIGELRKVRIEIAADYLVMAAWLAYLKSKLLVPEPEKEGEPSGADMAARLALQLRRLEAMRNAADQLMRRNQVGLAMFLRGQPEGVRIIRKSVYNATLYELLKAYSEFRASKGSSEALTMKMARRRVVSVEEALARLRNMIGQIPDWAILQSFLPPELGDDPFTMRSALASTFNASLEMAKQGMIELKQVQSFGPIYVRRQAAAQPTVNPEE